MNGGEQNIKSQVLTRIRANWRCELHAKGLQRHRAVGQPSSWVSFIILCLLSVGTPARKLCLLTKPLRFVNKVRPGSSADNNNKFGPRSVRAARSHVSYQCCRLEEMART